LPFISTQADGAVAELAGVAGGDHAAGHGAADLAHAFQRGVGADAFVGGDRHFLARDAAGGLVDHAHHRGHRHDLVVELAGRCAAAARCWLRTP
jgi:hypothetical protein